MGLTNMNRIIVHKHTSHNSLSPFGWAVIVSIVTLIGVVPFVVGVVISK